MEGWLIIVVTASIFLCTALAGILPVLLIRKFKRGKTPKGQRFTSGLNCLVAGVFLALSMLHMLPEVRDLFHSAKYDDVDPHSATDHMKEEYQPFPEITLLCGVSLILLLEQLAHTYLDEGEFDSISQNSLPQQSESTPMDFLTPTQNAAVRSARSRREPSLNGSERSHCSVHTMVDQANELMQKRSQWRSLTLFIALSIHAVFEGISFYQVATANEDDDHSRRRRSLAYGITYTTPRQPRSVGRIPDPTANEQLPVVPESYAIESLPASVTEGEITMPIMLRSTSAPMEEESHEEGINWKFVLFVGAILFHKSVMALTLALKLVQQQRFTLPFISVLILVFASMKPIGVAFSMVFQDILPRTFIASLSGISAGTFIYIVFFEILAEEFGCAHVEIIAKDSLSKIQKSLCFILGLGIITITMLTTEHAH